MILWEGNSNIDNKPIVAIMTGIKSSSSNSKTGDMPQVWILRSDMHPMDALKTGEDKSICGSCIYRPTILGPDALKKTSRLCYVSPMAFNSVYKAYKAGNYPMANLSVLAKQLASKRVRIGAYGDPAAVPIKVWDTLLEYCASTGYTHQWRNCDLQYAKYCMASCDSPIDVILATSKGYRTFFVQNTSSFDNVLRDVTGIKLAWCPASKEKGKVTTCSKCMACSGTRTGLHSNIAIMIH